MADAKISALTALTAAPSSADEFVVVDKSDTTDAATGTTKRITAGNLSLYVPDARIIELIPMIESLQLASGAPTRNASNAVTSFTIAWSRVIPGATNGTFTGVAHGTFPQLIDTWTAEYPDGTDDNGNTTLTVDNNISSTTGLAAPNAPAMS